MLFSFCERKAVDRAVHVGVVLATAEAVKIDRAQGDGLVAKRERERVKNTILNYCFIIWS